MAAFHAASLSLTDGSFPEATTTVEASSTVGATFTDAGGTAVEAPQPIDPEESAGEGNKK